MLTTMLCLLYAAGCFGAALFFVGRLKGVDRSAQVPTPPVPSTLDPLEIAYLRGGRGDVLRATLVGLEANSQVRVTSDNKFERTALTLPGSNPVETAVLDALTAQKTFSEVARASGGAMTVYLAPRVAHLHAEQLAVDERLASRLWPIAILIAVITAIAGALLAGVALVIDYPRGIFGNTVVWVALPYAVTWLVTLVIVMRAARSGRLTDRGRRYFKALTTVFPEQTLRQHVNAPVTSPLTLAGAGGLGIAAPLLVGLYGVSALQQTPYQNVYAATKPQHPDGSGGCSLSYGGCGSCGCCGSGGGCGGSCSGGGCGGCGGGGCGA